MNIIYKAAAVAALPLLLVACGGDTTEYGQGSNVNYHDVKQDLQGTVFDAITGERIDRKDLKVTIVQGKSYRKASLNKNYAGDYYIGGIPTSANGNITYRIMAEKEGYQTVVSTYSPSYSTSATDINLQDKRSADIGNFYLYPVGASATDVKAQILFDGKPVDGATVLLKPTSFTTALTVTAATATFSPTMGYEKSLQATTDADGRVTFAAAELVLGGQYNLQVLPTTKDGVQLALNNAGAAITVGTSPIDRVLTLTDVVNYAGDLYITNTSNRFADQLAASGALTITLNKPVTIVSQTDLVATLANAKTAVLATPSASASVVGSTITITPSFTTPILPLAADRSNLATADTDVSVTYSGNIFVQVAGKKGFYNLFDLITGDGTAVNKTVNITQPAF